MLVPSSVIQIQFPNAMPLAAEDFNPLLKDMNKVFWEIVSVDTNFPKKTLPFQITLRSGVYNIGNLRRSNCITLQVEGKKQQNLKKKKQSQKTLLLTGLAASGK